jgi:hypothetical protein
LCTATGALILHLKLVFPARNMHRDHPHNQPWCSHFRGDSWFPCSFFIFRCSSDCSYCTFYTAFRWCQDTTGSWQPRSTALFLRTSFDTARILYCLSLRSSYGRAYISACASKIEARRRCRWMHLVINSVINMKTYLLYSLLNYFAREGGVLILPYGIIIRKGDRVCGCMWCKSKQLPGNGSNYLSRV